MTASRQRPTKSAAARKRSRRSILGQLPGLLPRSRGGRAAVVASTLTVALAAGLATQASVAAQGTAPAALPAQQQTLPEVKVGATQFHKVSSTSTGQKLDFSVLSTLSTQSATAGAEAIKSAREAAQQATALREAADAIKAEAAPPTQVDDPSGAQSFASTQLGKFGWEPGEMQCLVTLWTRESDWKTTAQNSSSGAYGIVQALPGTKMASVGDDWQTNYKTQIKWGLKYIQDRYGSPCGALAFHYANNWY
ncbi:hypothetical protein [Arthrobacter sp. NPDC090010]|uniref:aggregation-promoting factor C-terminal-like domain-containing protein n=1 Tax=Arthrobacter sp. NPDC090010 TaxID=3363942 RepID=UPI0037FEE506